jgi:hypothetical protein
MRKSLSDRINVMTVAVTDSIERYSAGSGGRWRLCIDSRFSFDTYSSETTPSLLKISQVASHSCISVINCDIFTLI